MLKAILYSKLSKAPYYKCMLLWHRNSVYICRARTFDYRQNLRTPFAALAEINK